MAKVRACDSDWNWVWGKGKQNYAHDSIAVSFLVKMKLQSWVGDCFFSEDDYIDWNYLLGNKNTEDAIKQSVYNTISLHPEIVSIKEVSINTDYDLRKTTISYSYIDIYGENVERITNV